MEDVHPMLRSKVIQTQLVQARVIELSEHLDLSISPTLRTVTVRIPLIRNPNELRIRMPFWLGKIWRSIRELQEQVSGMSISLMMGWCAEGRLWDPHLCIDFDTEITDKTRDFLYEWKQILKERFRQESIYMRISEPVKWI